MNIIVTMADSQVDESNSYRLYQIKCLDLKDTICLVQEELDKDPGPSLSSLQFLDSDLSTTDQSFRAFWSTCQHVILSSCLNIKTSK